MKELLDKLNYELIERTASERYPEKIDIGKSILGGGYNLPFFDENEKERTAFIEGCMYILENIKV